MNGRWSVPEDLSRAIVVTCVAAVAAALGVTGAQLVDIDLEAPPVDALVAGLPGLHEAVAGAAGVA